MRLTDSDSILSSKSNSNQNMNVELPNVSSVNNNDKKEISVLNDKQDFEDPLVLNSKVQKHFSPITRQVIAVSGPLIATVCSGLTTGYSAILLPQLKSENSTIPITEDEGSWIASMAALPMAFGCLIGGILMDRYGRKTTQVLVCINFLIGWCILSFSTSITHLLVGRFTTGLSVGALGPPASVYIAECTAPTYRGLFLAVISFSISLGILIAHIIGTFISWQVTAMICATTPCMCIAFLYFAPESPNYLASKGNFKGAESSFLWLRGYTIEAQEELNELLNKYYKMYREKSFTDMTQSEKNFKSKQSTKVNHKLTILQQLTKLYFWKPFLIMNAFFAITQCSGVSAVAFYSVSIIQDTLGENFNSYLAMAIIDITRLIMSVIACVLLKNYTRRSLAIISSISTGIILIFLSIFIHTVDMNSKSGLEYIPLVSLVLYICFISVGLVPLPWVMIGEVFPSSVRSVGTGLTSCMCFIYFFIVVKTAPYLFLHWGPSQTFGLYGSVALVGCIILSIFLPETKGKTLEDIETKMKGTKQYNDL